MDFFFKNGPAFECLCLHSRDDRGHPDVDDDFGLLHLIGQSPNFLPDEEVQNRQGSGLDRPTRLHQISGRAPNPNLACPHSSACFNVQVACRIESASCSGHPALSRPAAPHQNPDRRLVKPSPEALPANRFLPACRSVPVVDSMAAARWPRPQRRL